MAGEIWSENSNSISLLSRELRASRIKRELKLTRPFLSTEVSILESFSPYSFATDLTEKVSGDLVSQIIEPPTERAKRAASLVIRINSSRSRVTFILLFLGMSFW